jgi:hypothetical protein
MSASVSTDEAEAEAADVGRRCLGLAVNAAVRAELGGRRGWADVSRCQSVSASIQ